MKRFVSAVLSFVLAVLSAASLAAAQGSAVSVSSSEYLISSGVSLIEPTLSTQYQIVVKQNGGLLLDYLNNSFIYQSTPNGSSPSIFKSLTNGCSTILTCTVVSSPKLIWNIAGKLVQTTSNSLAEFCYNGDNNSPIIKGLCIEQQNMNMLLQSSAFTNAAWTKTGVTAADNSAADPTGGTGATTLTEDTSTGLHEVKQAITKPAASHKYISCVYFAGGEGNRNLTIRVDDGGGNGAMGVWDTIYNDPPVVLAVGTGSVPFTSVVSLQDGGGSSGMFRECMSYASSSTTTLNIHFGLANGTSTSYAGNGTSQMIYWTAENGTFTSGSAETATGPSSPIPTTTATVTRVRDQIDILLPTAMVGASAYSIFNNMTLAVSPNGLNNVYTALVDSTKAHRLMLYQTVPGSNGVLALQSVDTTTFNLNTAAPLNLYNQQFGLAGAFKSGDYWLENTGQSMSTGTSTVYPSTNMTDLLLGELSTANSNSGNIALSQILVSPSRIPNSTMQSLLFVTPPFNPDTITGPNYFTQAMINSRVPSDLEVFQIANVPANDSVPGTSYAAYPLTVAVAGNIASQLSSTATLTKFAWLFSAVRCNLCAGVTNFGLKPSGYSSPAIRTAAGLPTAMSFTTYARSLMVRRIQELYVLGFPAHASGACAAGLEFCGYADAANSVGIADASLISYLTAVNSPDSVFTTAYTLGTTTWMTTVDQIIMPNARMVDGTQVNWGLTCDCEANDSVPASLVTPTEAQMTAVAHSVGLKYADGADDILGVGQYSGMCGLGATAPNCDVANLNAIANVVDKFFVLYGPKPQGYATVDAAFQARIAMFGASGTFPAAAIAVSVPLGKWPAGNTVTGAQNGHADLVAAGYKGVEFSPAGGSLGGQQCRYTNEVVAIWLGLDTSACAPLPP